MKSGKPLRWDSELYARFTQERARPFFDLLARVPDAEVRRAADLGCGSGELTRILLERWPKAEVWGVDSSGEMLARARSTPAPANLHFVKSDLRDWGPPAPLDLILSNAALQWVPDHARLLERLSGMLGPAGILAVQVPNNRGEAAYRILEGLLAESPWAKRIPQDLHHPRIEPPKFYEQELRTLGFQVDLWEITYQHHLSAPAEIVEWIKGTTLRPVLSALSESDAAEFLAVLAPRIRAAYPAGADGVVFPFRRFFFVAKRAV